MQRFQSLLTAVEATRHLPFSALWGHLMRRVRNKLVPKAPGLYRRRLQSRAQRLPPFAPQDASRQIAAVTATFFRAKHAKNAQSCLEGRFTFLNKTIDFGGVDKIDWLIQAEPGNHQAWRSNLGFMGYLCSAAEQDPHAALALAGKIVDTFPKAADFSASSQFNEVWHPNVTPIAGRLPGQHAPPELRSRAANPSFLLSPGHIRRYKNLEACIALFDRIKAPGQIFVIAGPAADRAYADEIQAQIAGRNDILMISRELSDAEINWCYQNADAVLSLRSPEGNSGVMFSALSNSARVITRPGPVTTEIAQQVGPGWLIEVSDNDQQIAADIANKPTKPPQLQWCHPTIVAQQHLNFMNSL